MKTDAELEADVEAELLWDPRIDADSLLVSVRSGIVSLVGHVASYAEKSAAESAAKKIAGVRALVNDIEVRPKAPPSDQEIAAAAIKALKSTVTVPSDTIQIVVSDSWITLEGQVISRRQRDCAEESVRNLWGLKGINNAIVVQLPMDAGDIWGKISAAFQRHAEIDANRITVPRQARSLRTKRIRRSDGTEFPLEISLSPLRDGSAAAAIRDVSDRKRVEQELINAREEADRANLSKSRFLATASHDLRQPLQALSMLHGTLCRMNTDPNSRDVLVQQGRAIDSMKRLLSALLDISKLESGAVKPQPSDFSIQQLFELLNTEFSTAARSKGLTLAMEHTDLHTCTDRSLLEQLLRNLIANAIKYTSAGAVTLRATRTATGVRVAVQDTGVGIPEDQLAFIFDEFFQVDVARNITREGYGLGLAIVQRIAKLLGLRIEVQSEVGKGSTFMLELPRIEQSTSNCASDTSASGSYLVRHAQSGKILVTEDEPSVLQATRLLLELEGYQVIAATSRDEALQRGREHPDLDLLVSDYHLKEDQTGLNVIGEIRELLKRNIPAILVTGDTSSAMRKLPGDRQLRLASKPIDAEELLSLMNELLYAQRAT